MQRLFCESKLCGATNCSQRIFCHEYKRMDAAPSVPDRWHRKRRCGLACCGGRRAIAIFAAGIRLPRRYRKSTAFLATAHRGNAGRARHSAVPDRLLVRLPGFAPERSKRSEGNVLAQCLRSGDGRRQPCHYLVGVHDHASWQCSRDYKRDEQSAKCCVPSWWPLPHQLSYCLCLVLCSCDLWAHALSTLDGPRQPLPALAAYRAAERGQCAAECGKHPLAGLVEHPAPDILHTLSPGTLEFRKTTHLPGAQDFVILRKLGVNL